MGWPPTEGGPPYARAPVDEDAYAPDVLEPEVVADTASLDVGNGETTPLPPCAALIAQACELWGPHSDACAEARRHVPDDGHPATAEACQALLTRFVHDEIPRGGGCWRWVAAVCRELGQESERCREVKTLLPLIKTKRETRICLGDWIWFEARALRR